MMRLAGHGRGGQGAASNAVAGRSLSHGAALGGLACQQLRRVNPRSPSAPPHEFGTQWIPISLKKQAIIRPSARKQAILRREQNRDEGTEIH